MPRPSAKARATKPTTADTARGRILQTARTRFFTQGFHSVTMEDLANELGMSKKTLYRHFASKEAVLDAILDTLAAEVGSMLARVSGDRSRPVRARLRELLQDVARRLAPIQPVFLLSLRRFAPAHLDKLEQLRRRNLEQHLTPLLEEGRADGEIRTGIEPAFVVELLLGALHAMLEPATLQRLDLTPSHAASRTLDTLFEGIFVHPPTRSAHRP